MWNKQAAAADVDVVASLVWLLLLLLLCRSYEWLRVSWLVDFYVCMYAYTIYIQFVIHVENKAARHVAANTKPKSKYRQLKPVHVCSLNGEERM